MNLSIMEWNINQRSGYGNGKIPFWIAEEIQNHDIVIFTEFYRTSNVREFLDKAFVGYIYKITENPINQNDVLIAIKENIEYLSHEIAKSEKSNNIPNFLRLDCKIEGNIFTIVGARIRDKGPKEKYEQMKFIIEKLKGVKNPIVIAGDFNNYRRATTQKDWNLSKLDELLGKEFKRYTPPGSSIFEEETWKNEYEFALDHIIGKDCRVEIQSYDRDFVTRDKNIYKWGRDFKKYHGKDKNGKYLNETIKVSFPDHAIVRGVISCDNT